MWLGARWLDGDVVSVILFTAMILSHSCGTRNNRLRLSPILLNTLSRLCSSLVSLLILMFHTPSVSGNVTEAVVSL